MYETYLFFYALDKFISVLACSIDFLSTKVTGNLFVTHIYKVASLPKYPFNFSIENNKTSGTYAFIIVVGLLSIDTV